MAVEFEFPGKPYSQQVELMSDIFYCIEAGTVAILESPTGTGKTLSLICSSLLWQHREENKLLHLSSSFTTSKRCSKSDWLRQFESKGIAVDHSQPTKGLLRAVKQREHILDRISTSKRWASFSSQSRQQFYTGERTKNSDGEKPIEQASSALGTTNENIRATVSPEDAEYLLIDCSSDNDAMKEMDSDGESDDDSSGGFPKIIYCSRTQSQLAQFIHEIRRTVYKDIRCISLSSRKSSCINTEVNPVIPSKIGGISDALISEKCLDMQKRQVKHPSKPAPLDSSDKTVPPRKSRKLSGEPQSSGPCPFHSRSAEEMFVGRALGQICDVEDLVHIGRQSQGCPYYGARRAVKYAQVIAMPYNMLLQEDMRKSLGIRLKDNVIVFDEAHNLIDVVNQLHSTDLSLATLTLAIRTTQSYLEHFRDLLNGKNFLVVGQLLGLLGGIKQYMLSRTTSPSTNTGAAVSDPSTTVGDKSGGDTTAVMTANDFIFACRIDNMNLFRLKSHLFNSNLVRRVGGFGDARLLRDHPPVSQGTSGCRSTLCVGYGGASVGVPANDHPSSLAPCTAALRSVLTLLCCLTNANADGRVVISGLQSLGPRPTVPAANVLITTGSSEAAGDVMVRYTLLNPREAFRPIVDQAKSVLLLGGTLQPFNLLSSFLFPDLPPGRLRTLSYGHVVPRQNVFGAVLTSGPTVKSLEIRYKTRSDPTVMSEIGAVVARLCAVIPFGVVTFFTSYAYLEKIIARWASDGTMGVIRGGRPVFVEPRSAVAVDEVWTAYSTAAVQRTGALLLCVMGGKLSEGINFSDHLARGVLVVGMPYPDISDVILKERLGFADSIIPNSRNDLYEALCMKSVNQSIGRAIRHINDYAAVFLIDNRYSQNRVMQQLPTWIRESTVVYSGFGKLEAATDYFFRTRS